MCVMCIQTIGPQLCVLRGFCARFPGALFKISCLVRCSVMAKAVGC